MATARPSGLRGIDRRRSGSAAAMARSTLSSRPGTDRTGVRFHRIHQVRERCDAEPFVQERELFERDGPAFVQPPQIGWQIGDGGFNQHPGAGLVELARAVAGPPDQRRRAGSRTADRDSSPTRSAARGRPRRRARGAAVRPGRRGCGPPLRDRRAYAREGRLLRVIRKGWPASLSTRRVRAVPAAGLPWSRSAGSPPASR